MCDRNYAHEDHAGGTAGAHTKKRRAYLPRIGDKVMLPAEIPAWVFQTPSERARQKDMCIPERAW
jgi:hypothetical protein